MKNHEAKIRAYLSRHGWEPEVDFATQVIGVLEAEREAIRNLRRDLKKTVAFARHNEALLESIRKKLLAR